MATADAVSNIAAPTQHEMIPIPDSYWLFENLPNAMLIAYPDSGHGSLLQSHESFTHQAKAFLFSNSRFAPY